MIIGPKHNQVLLPTVILRKAFRPLNDWIDSLQEPWRFIAVMIVALGWTGFLDHRDPVLNYVGLSWLLLVGLWALTRGSKRS